MNLQHKKIFFFKNQIKFRLLLNIVLIIASVFAFYLMLSLASFSPYDPSWLQTTTKYNKIYNIGGLLGAWLSDTMFFIFGLLAYTLPMLISFFCIYIYMQYNKHKYINLFNLLIRLISSLILLVLSCVLTSLNIDDLCYFTSGGLVGTLLRDFILSRFSIVNINFFLLSIWIYGLITFIGWSWMFAILKKMSKIVFTYAKFIFNRFNFY